MIDQSKFMAEFLDLCDRHGIADYAIVAHGLAGGEAFSWVAGTGDGVNLIGDRERAGKLYFNVMGVGSDILARTWLPPEPKVAVEDMGD